jgi:hypothetical protein
MKKIFIIVLIFLSVLTGCKQKKSLIIDYSNSKIEYSGRIDTVSLQAAQISWSGSSIKLNFEGESIHAMFDDEKGENYYNIIIDNNLSSVLKLDTVKRFYELASNLEKGKHSVEIFKRTEWGNGLSNFYGFKINNGKVLPKSNIKKRKMEFYGNSVSAGYAVDDLSGRDLHDSIYTNNYKSYAALTARHYDAKYHCICKSGIGVTVSWDSLIMPEIYDKLIPTNSSSFWDFSNYSPDIVVVNLFQNDSWLVKLPNHEEYIKRFNKTPPTDYQLITAYQNFILNLRKQYPKTNIICTLGSMDAAKQDSKWIKYIKTAVNNLKDDKIYTHIMPYIESNTHPSEEDNQVMSKDLINFIDNHIDW